MRLHVTRRRTTITAQQIAVVAPLTIIEFQSAITAQLRLKEREVRAIANIHRARRR
jgi:hypothetical protein